MLSYRSKLRLAVRCFSAIALVLAGTACSQGADRRPDSSVLTVMTLNAEFLWDGVAPEEGQPNFPWKNSETEATEHMEAVAAIIRQSSPDILHLVPVENEQALGRLNNNHLQGMGYQPYFVKGKDTYTGQDVALLTRIDPESNQIHRDDGTGQSGTVTKGVSKNLYAKFTIGSMRIAIVGVHLLAQPNMESRRRQREAQADVIRRRASTLRSEGYLVIVLGDLNDYDGDAACRDHIDSMPITNVLSMIKGMNTPTPQDDLVNAAEFVPKASRYTAFWDQNEDGNIQPEREYTSIDHILLSPELRARVRFVEMSHNHDPRRVTDHFPVVVQFASDGSATLLIVRLLPNPPGSDLQGEEATVRNVSNQAVNMNGWTLRDFAGKTWDLSSLGTLQPGAEATITRNGQPMALNNDGDTVELRNPNGQVVDTVTYGSVEGGEEVTRAQ